MLYTPRHVLLHVGLHVSSARDCGRTPGQDLPQHHRGRRHLVCPCARQRHGAARRQRRRQDHDDRDHHGSGRADRGPRHGARRRHAARALPRAAPDELREPLCRDAAPAHGPAEPQGVRRALRRPRRRRPHRRARRRARSRRADRPGDRQALLRPAHAGRARQGADQPARGAAARRADRFARSGHRRLGARAARSLSPRARRDRAHRVAQHGRGRAPVRARHHHEAGRDRRRRRAGGAARPLRPRHPRAGLPRRGARAERGRTMRSPQPAAISITRIAAMVRRYWYLLRSSWPRLLDLVYWPTVQMITWGFLQFYIMQNAGFFARAGGTFIGAVLLWDILFRGQLGFSISFMEEMWARNIGNLMMSPLRPLEFITALMVMSIVRLAVGVIPVTLLCIAFFGFNLYALGLALAAFFVNLMLTSWAVGIFVSGLVLRNGLGAENLAWSIMFLFMPLTCVYYPVTTLPAWLQQVAWALPPTYVFEGMRALLIDHTLRADLMLKALALNAILMALGIFGFLKLLQAARRHGSLMQTGE